MNNINRLKVMGDEYFKKSLFIAEKIEVKYSKDDIFIGYDAITKKPFPIDYSEANRICTIGLTRSGKTWIMRAKGDRLYKANRAVVYLTDVKDEFKSSRKPIQEKFHNLLMPNETPQGFRIVTLRPTFFKDINGYEKLPEDNFWYSPDLSLMSKSDFFTFFSNVAKGEIKKLALELMYTAMLRKVKKLKDTNYTIVEILEACVEELEDFTTSQKAALHRMLIPLRESHFFEKNCVKNITKLIAKGYILTINLSGFEKIGKDAAFLYPEVLLSIVHREIVDARRNGKIKPVYIFLDECVRFIGKGCNTSFKYDVAESFDLNTKFGVNYDIATQYIDKIDEGMLEQCRYVFIPRTATTKTIQQSIISFGLTRNIQRSVNDSITLKTQLQKYPHSWLILDRTTGKHTILLPTAPLSNHMETEDE